MRNVLQLDVFPVTPKKHLSASTVRSAFRTVVAIYRQPSMGMA